jgi:hypothetical protein
VGDILKRLLEEVLSDPAKNQRDILLERAAALLASGTQVRR